MLNNNDDDSKKKRRMLHSLFLFLLFRKDGYLPPHIDLYQLLLGLLAPAESFFFSSSFSCFT
jgi:hypothetical protein